MLFCTKSATKQENLKVYTEENDLSVTDLIRSETELKYLSEVESGRVGGVPSEIGKIVVEIWCYLPRI